MKSARAAFSVWSRVAPADRKAVLQAWASLIDKHQLELTLLETLEAGKPVSETYNGLDWDVAVCTACANLFSGDILETAKCIRWFAGSHLR